MSFMGGVAGIILGGGASILITFLGGMVSRGVLIFYNSCYGIFFDRRCSIWTLACKASISA